jgi:1-acyl-sn-glycerol-3-phosphate acyltransferase
MPAWTFFSTAIYGTICIITGVFSRKAAQAVGKAWCRHLLALSGIRFVVHGAEKIDKRKNYIVIANHGSALDIPVLIAAFPQTLVFMAKKELFRIPIFGWGMAVVGHLCVDRSNARKARTTINKAVTRIQKEKLSVALFPEGTRSQDGCLGEFRNASFALAIEAKTWVAPMIVRGASALLPKNSLLVSPGTVEVIIGDPISPDIVAGHDRKTLAPHVRNIMTAMCNE